MTNYNIHHRKYRNLVHRLLCLIRQQHLVPSRVSLPDTVIDLSVEDLSDSRIADTVACATYVSIRVYDEQRELRGQFTLDQERKPEEAVVDFTPHRKYRRIAQTLRDEFKS